MKKLWDNVSEIISNFLIQGRKLKIYEESREVAGVREDLRQIKNEIRNTEYPITETTKIKNPSQQNHGAVL